MTATDIEHATGTAVGAGDALPLVKGRPITGVLPELRSDPMGLFTRTANEYGGLVRLNLGTSEAWLVSEPEILKSILQEKRRNFVKSHYLNDLHIIIGDGVFMAEGDAWKDARHVVQKSFHTARMSGFVDQMTETTGEMLERWRAKQRRGEPIEVVQETMRLTLDVILRTMFSRRLDATHQVLYDTVSWLLRDLERRFWRLVPIPPWAPVPSNRQRARAIKVLDEFVYGIIEERRRSPGSKDDLLERLITIYEEEGGASRDMLRNEALTFIIAGQDTTASALTWMLCELSRHPELARQYKAEVDRITQGRTPQIDDLDQFEFGHRFFKETLRLNPPAWTFSRMPLVDDELAGHPIKARTTVIMPIYALHRRADLWDNPEGFDPDRFTEDNEQRRHRFAYIPFGGGPRACIGARFSTLENLAVTAMILQNHRLELVPGYKVEHEPMFIQRPRGGLRMRLCDA